MICDNSRIPSGIFNSLSGHTRASKLLLKQIGWSEYQKDYVWKIIIEAKINNQINLIKMLKPEICPNTLSLMEDCFNKVELGDVTNREGHLAKLY